MTIPKYKAGDRVRLRANREEGWPEREATVVEYEAKYDVYCVVVSPDGANDDGYREVTEDQICLK